MNRFNLLSRLGRREWRVEGEVAAACGGVREWVEGEKK